MEALAACHVHSDWSYDGSWSLADLSTKFSCQGYRVLMMTEHDRGFTASRLEEFRIACAKASSDKLLIVPGIEYSDPANRVHVLVWGRVPFLGEGLPTTEMLVAAKAANGLAVLAHPSRKKVWESFDPQWVDCLLGIEVWNRKYDGWAPSETSPALLQSSQAVPFVGLDFHTERQSFPLAMALDVDSGLTEDGVLDCLRLRRCSARAFGAPLDQNLLLKAMPALRIAERGRRTVASLAKRSGVLSR